MRYLLIFLLFSCTPEKRLQKLIEKHPGLVKTEIDTVYTESVAVDTFFKYTTIKDTVIVHKDKLTMKYFYNNTDSTVFLSGLCDKDTVIVEKQIFSVNDSQSWPSILKKNMGFLGSILLALLVLCIIAFIKK